MHPPKGHWAQVHAPPPKGAWAPLVAPPGSAPARQWHTIPLQAVLLVLALFVAPNLYDILESLGKHVPSLPFRYGHDILENLPALLVALAAAGILGAGAVRDGLAHALGLAWNGWRGPVLALVASLPCWVGDAFITHFSWNRTVSQLLVTLPVIFLAQEVVFRGFGFIYARRALRWYLLLAMTLQALAFSPLVTTAVSLWREGGSLSGPFLSAHLPLLLTVLPSVLYGLLIAILDMLDGYSLWSGWLWRTSVTLAATMSAISAGTAFPTLAASLPLASGLAAILLLWLLVPRTPGGQTGLGHA
jgi:hypothetical protein